MPALTFPSRTVNPEQLRAELGAALGIPEPYVDAYPNRLEVVGMVDEGDRARVEAVLDAHVPNPDFGRAEEDREFARLRMKATAVFAGTDTFSTTQVQKILAALVLRATR